MDKSYQPVASDEEHLQLERPLLQQPTNDKLRHLLSRNWNCSQAGVWLCHAMLLSVVFSFALSYCLRCGAASQSTYECRLYIHTDSRHLFLG